jgi:hypothetical protein
VAKSGTVVEISVQTRGSHAVGAHAAGATALLVADPTPYDENGGQVYADGQAYTYSSMGEVADTVDPESMNGLLALTTGLVGPVADTMPVEVWTGAQVLDDVVLWVSVSDEGDPPVPVTLLSDQRDKWEARLGPAEPPVSVLLSDDYTTLLDAPGYTPSINGGAIVGLPDQAAVALEPPAASPSITGVTGNAEGLVVVTEPVLPSTLLDFYVNGVLVAEGQRTTILQLSYEDLARTVPMVVEKDYTVTVWAQNGAGAAPTASPGQTARLNPGVTVAMVTGLLQAGMVLTGSIQIGTQTTIDQNGWTTTHPDGRQTYMRSDGSGNQWVGQAILDAATILGSLTILGLNNFLNGVMTLGKGVSDPTAKPGVTNTHDSTDLDSVPPYTLRGLFDDGARWLFTETLTGTGGNVWRITKTAGTVALVAIPQSKFEPLGGVVKVGTSYYVLGKDGNRGGDWWVFVYNSSWTKTGEWAPTAAASESLALGIDGAGGLLVAKRTAGNTLYVSEYSVAGAVGSTANCGTTWGAVTLTGITKAPVDTATVRYVVTALGHGIRVFNTSTGARVAGEEWTPAVSAVNGISHDGTNWHTFDGSAVWHYTNLIGTWDFGFTWVDNDPLPGGSDTAETKLSAIRTVAPLKRARWVISLPSAPPDDGTTNGANTASLYAATTGSTPGLIAALPEGTMSKTFDTLTPGAAAPVTSGFANRSGAVGRIKSAAVDSGGDPLTDSDGTGHFRAAKFQQSGSRSVPVPTVGVVAQLSVTFDVPFDTVPKVVTEPAATDPGVVFSGHHSVTALGFVLTVKRTATTGNTLVDFIATTA